MDPARAQLFDSEYASLMAELGETSSSAPLGGGGTAADQSSQVAAWNSIAQMGGQPVDERGEKIPPWRIPSNW